MMDDLGVMFSKKLAVAFMELLPSLPIEGRLLETGTGYGDSAAFFSRVLPKWKIYTVDAFGLFGDGRIYNRLDHDKVQAVMNRYSGGNNVIQILGNSGEVPWELPLDVLYIDADHTEAGCRKDFENYAPFVFDDGLIIFDDYIQENNPNNGVKNVIHSIHGYERRIVDTAVILKKL
jgi:predicted O-methyltransferase YrrM